MSELISTDKAAARFKDPDTVSAAWRAVARVTDCLRTGRGVWLHAQSYYDPSTFDKEHKADKRCQSVAYDSVLTKPSRAFLITLSGMIDEKIQAEGDACNRLWDVTYPGEERLSDRYPQLSREQDQMINEHYIWQEKKINLDYLVKRIQSQHLSVQNNTLSPTHDSSSQAHDEQETVGAATLPQEYHDRLETAVNTIQSHLSQDQGSDSSSMGIYKEYMAPYLSQAHMHLKSDPPTSDDTFFIKEGFRHILTRGDNPYVEEASQELKTLAEAVDTVFCHLTDGEALWGPSNRLKPYQWQVRR